MLPLSSPIAILAGVRPVSLLRADLTQILKDGRLIAAQVLESTEPGRAWIGIAGLRVEADSEVDLQPGERFLAHVEERDGQIVLRRVPPPATDDETLVRALRSVVAEELPAGDRLGRLVEVLRDAMRTADPEQVRVIETLLQKLQGGTLPPHADGAALHTALLSSGVFHEALLGRAALLAGTPAGVQYAELAREDQKGLLLAALTLVEDEPARLAIQHAIDGLEADQLLEVVRARAGEPQITNLALPDAHGWTSVRITSDREHDTRRDAAPDDSTDLEGSSKQSSRHARLSVHFSNLGAIRADFDLSSTDLRVRFTVERREIAELLRADLERLITEVAVEGKPSTVSVFESRDVAIDPALTHADVGFLRDHPLMDLSG